MVFPRHKQELSGMSTLLSSLFSHPTSNYQNYFLTTPENEKGNDLTSSSSDQENEIQPGINADADVQEFENFPQVLFPIQTDNGKPVCLCTEPTLVEPRLIAYGTQWLGSAGSSENQNQADKQPADNIGQGDVESKGGILLFCFCFWPFCCRTSSVAVCEDYSNK